MPHLQSKRMDFFLIDILLSKKKQFLSGLKFLRQTLEPKTTYKMNVDFVPSKAGMYSVLIDIDSNEIQV